MNHIYDHVKGNFNDFKTTEEALDFILNQQVIKNFLGINVEGMSAEELFSFKNDFLSQLKLISYKYKK